MQNIQYKNLQQIYLISVIVKKKMKENGYIFIYLLIINLYII